MFRLDKYLFRPLTEETIKKEIEEATGKSADITVDNSTVSFSSKYEDELRDSFEPLYASFSGTIPFTNTYITTDFKTVALPELYINRINLNDYAICNYYPEAELENSYYSPRESLEEENRSLKKEIKKLKKQLGEIIE